MSLRVGKHAAEALVDTGAVCSMISEPFAKQLKLTIQPLEGPSDRMVSANGSTIRVVGTVSMNLYLRGLIVEHTVVVDKTSGSCCHGADARHLIQASTDMPADTLIFQSW